MLADLLGKGLVLRREITRDGLYVALGFVVAATGLVGSVLGLIVGPSDQTVAVAVLRGSCLLMLVGFAHMRQHPEDAAAVKASRADQTRERVGAFWAVLLAGSTAAAIPVDGSSRGVAVVSICQLGHSGKATPCPVTKQAAIRAET